MKGCARVMYAIKEITLQHGQHERKRSVITFEEREKQIVGEFLMSDAPMLQFAIIQDIEIVLRGEESCILRNGNRCSIKITKNTTHIEDLYTDLYEGLHTYAPYEMDTTEVLSLVRMWKKHIEENEKT